MVQSAVAHLVSEDAFEDLGDMQALSKLQTETAEFIAENVESGRAMENPLAFVRQAIALRQQVIGQMADFIAACERPAAELKSKPLHLFYQQEIADIQTTARKRLDILPRYVYAFARRLGDFRRDNRPLFHPRSNADENFR